MERSRALGGTGMIVRTGLLAVLVLCVGCDSEQAPKPGPPPAPIGRHLVYAGDKGVWIAEPDGGRPRLLVADGSGPSISPDGKWVIYFGGECDPADSADCGSTYLVSTKFGAKPRPLGGEAGWPTRWLPDSQAIVTERSLNGVEDELVRMEVADGKETALAHGDFWGWSLSPDGTSLVFGRAHGDAKRHDVFPAVDLYVVDVGGGDPKAITDTGDSAYPAWGPKSIAFAKLIPTKYPSPNTEFARNEIWRIQPDGTDRRTISGPLPERLVKDFWHCIGLEPVDWSDDGSTLLAQVRCEGIGQTVAVDPQTGAISTLGEGTFSVGLSRDAQYALVQWGDERVGQENEEVLIYPYAGGKPTVVAKGAFGPDWNR